MLLIYSLGGWNLTATLLCYFILKRKKALFDDRFATTVTKTATLISTLILGIHFSVMLSIELSMIFLLIIVLGVLIGFLFGSLVKYFPNLKIFLIEFLTVLY